MGNMNPNFLNAGSKDMCPESTTRVIFSGSLKANFLGSCPFTNIDIRAQFLNWFWTYSEIPPRSARSIGTKGLDNVFKRSTELLAQWHVLNKSFQ